jgi:hypothetical protein
MVVSKGVSFLRRKPTSISYDPLLEFYGWNGALDKYIVQMYFIFASCIVIQNFSSASTLIILTGCALYYIYFARYDQSGISYQFENMGHPLVHGEKSSWSLNVPNLAINAVADGFRPDSVLLVIGNHSDFMERSDLLRPTVLLPKNFEKEWEVDCESVQCRIAHDIGHSYHRDYIFLNGMLISIGVCLYSFVLTWQPSFITGISYFLWLINAVFLLVLSDRLKSFFHFREYRADLFAYGMVGDKYLEHLSEMKGLEACFIEPSGLTGWMKSTTHPSFSARLERLKHCSVDFENCPWFLNETKKSYGHLRLIQVLSWAIPVTLAFAPFSYSYASVEMGAFQELDLRNKVLIYLSLYIAMLRIQTVFKKQERFYCGPPAAKRSE